MVTHELGHALGLGGSVDPTSPMYETLAAGVVQRTPTVADLNISDPLAGADPERAGPMPVSSGAAGLVDAWSAAQQAGSAAGNAPLQARRTDLNPFYLGNAAPICSGLPATTTQTAASFAEQGGSGWEAECPFLAGLRELPWDVQDEAPSAAAEWLQAGAALARPDGGTELQ